MPTNRIQVEVKDGTATCMVWDGEGNQHDVTWIFREVRDLATKDRVSTSLTLTANEVDTCIKFSEITKKELSFDVGSAIVKQILQML